MKTIEKINPELLEILDGWMDFFNAHNKEPLPMDERRFGNRDMDYYCSEEYLKELLFSGYEKLEGKTILEIGVFPGWTLINALKFA